MEKDYTVLVETEISECESRNKIYIYIYTQTHHEHSNEDLRIHQMNYKDGPAIRYVSHRPNKFYYPNLDNKGTTLMKPVALMLVVP